MSLLVLSEALKHIINWNDDFKVTSTLLLQCVRWSEVKCCLRPLLWCLCLQGTFFQSTGPHFIWPWLYSSWMLFLLTCLMKVKPILQTVSIQLKCEQQCKKFCLFVFFFFVERISKNLETESRTINWLLVCPSFCCCSSCSKTCQWWGNTAGMIIKSCVTWVSFICLFHLEHHIK